MAPAVLGLGVEGIDRGLAQSARLIAEPAITQKTNQLLRLPRLTERCNRPFGVMGFKRRKLEDQRRQASEKECLRMPSA